MFFRKSEKHDYGGLTFESITKKDIEPLSLVMKRAFDEDARRHEGGEYDSLEGWEKFIRNWYFAKGATAYKILKDGALIGGLNLFIKKDNTNYLGNMFVDTALQDKGLGLIIWQFAEQRFPNTIKWKTETPLFSKRNHHFYVNKCGFKVREITDQYYFEKEMK